MENRFDKGKVSDGTVLIMIWRVIEGMRSRNQEQTNQCIENQEKLIHLSMMCIEKNSIKALPYNLSEEIVKFIQKINRITMEAFKQDKEDVDLRLFSRAADLLMVPHIKKYMENQRVLDQLKVLTFNNLACVYKKRKMFSIALRAVSYALEIEESLVNQESCDEKYNIITTYLNKAAILSQMKKHQKAIQEINKSKKFIDKIQAQVFKQIEEATDPAVKARLQQKKYYGLYMKMIINYNMGAQKQHMKLIQSAKQFYKQGKQFALVIQNTYMVKKFDNILIKLR